MEFWKPYFQDTKKLLVTSAKEKQGNFERNNYFFFFHKKLPSEAAVCRCFFKKLFLKLSQYS